MPIRISNPFRRTLTTVELAGADVALVAGQFTEVGRLTVPAGQAFMVGYGLARGQAAAEGRVFMELDSTVPADIVASSRVRIDLHDPNDRAVKTLFEATAGALETSATDRTQQMPLPAQGDVAAENWAVVFKIRVAAAVTYDDSASVIAMDVTQYDAVRV